MRPQFCAIAIGLLALSTLAVAADEQAKAASYSEKAHDEDKNEKFFIASYQTTTYTALSTFVTTAPYVCVLTTAATKACAGRRLRRGRDIDLEERAIGRAVELEDSQGERIDTSEFTKKIIQKEKFFFTVWQTTTTTATVTSTFANTSITISASAYCTFPGYNVPLC